jgi:WD40 repeat protein
VKVSVNRAASLALAGALLSFSTVGLPVPNDSDAGSPAQESERAARWARIAFAPDGKTLAGGRDELVKVWDTSTAKEVLSLTGHTQPVTAVAFAPDGHSIASASLDGTVRLWSVTRAAETMKLSAPPRGASRIAFAPDGRVLAACTEPGIRLWDAASGSEVGLLKQSSAMSCSLAFSGDGRQLVSAHFGSNALLWDLRRQATVREFEGHRCCISSLSLAPDGKTLVSGGASVRFIGSGTGCGGRVIELGPGVTVDKSLRRWDVATAKQLGIVREAGSVFNLSHSPDGQAIAVASDQGLSVWGVGGRELTKTRTLTQQPTRDVAFSPDGTLVASVDAEGILFWNAATGERIASTAGSREKP